MGDMSKEYRPGQTLQSTVLDRPPTRAGGGKGRIPTVPDSGQGFRPDKPHEPHKKSHRLRNTVVGLAATSAVGTGVYVGTQGGSESSTNNTAAVTTVDLNPDGTISTTTQEPTTTLEPKPNDVVEHRDGYDVLRNGGFLYPVDSITVDGAEIDTSVFGGFQLHIKDGSNSYGFKETSIDGEAPQEVLLRNVLWTFGAQHPEFIKSDGGVDVRAYVAYLSKNGWIDAVSLPDNISEPAKKEKYPPVVPSSSLTLDFAKSIVLGSGDLGQVDGLNPFGGFYDYYYPTPSDTSRALAGITEGGQLFFSYHEIDPSTGGVKNLRMPGSIGPFSYIFGYILSVTANVGYPMGNPKNQWIAPYLAYFEPGGKVDASTIPDYKRLSGLVLDIFDFETTDFKNSALFAPVS